MEYTDKLFQSVKEKVAGFHSKRLSIEDLTSLNELLEAGLSMRNCLDLIRTSANEELISDLLKKLGRGMLMEEIVGDFLPGSIASYLKPLLKTMTFSRALGLALSFYEKTKENTRAIEKSVLYPFVLLFVSLTALYLFDAYGLDAILGMLRNFGSDMTSFKIIRIILRIIVYFFYFGMLIVISLLLYFSRDKNITLFYLLCSRYFKNSLLHVYFCEEFISLFLICMELGYKTKDALGILKALHNKPIVSFLAFHLEDKLLAGESIRDASSQYYFDESLSRFINVAVYTDDFVHVLNNYVILSQNRIAACMKRIANIIQASSYAAIGAVIIFIYQVLFLPMQAISNF
ncbi:MAG: type II secretion system F family protein [Erysipelotrichaceae bacterium]|nr:type II secretion system F family protein [Erysipelotrichaceae bacterium]